MSRMATYMHTLQTYKVVTATQRDEVDNFGQLLTFGGEVTYKVRTPDAFVIDVAEDDMARRYIYDGRSVIVFSPGIGYYARFPAPSTIRETLDLASAKYGVTVPLDDLFSWNRGETTHKNLTSAHVVGPAKVAGKDTMQYAFRQPGIDWQIWIAAGDKPLAAQGRDRRQRRSGPAAVRGGSHVGHRPDVRRRHVRVHASHGRHADPHPDCRSMRSPKMSKRVTKLAIPTTVIAGAVATALIISPFGADARGGGRGGFGGGGRGFEGGRSAPTSIERGGDFRGGGVDRGDFGRRDSEVNVNRNVNVNTSYNGYHGGYYGGDYHPVATGVAVGVAAGVTAAAIGSLAYRLPPGCTPYTYSGPYYQCGNVWYQPQYQGSNVTYVVVNPPR